MSQLSNNIAKQDSARGTPYEVTKVVMADAGTNKTWLIELDAPTNPWVRIRQIDSDGMTIAAAGEIKLDLASLSTSGLTNKSAEFRVLQWKDANDGCRLYQAAVLMTVPELA